MIEVLRNVCAALPSLLVPEQESEWKDVDVDYHPPRVERVWRDWMDYRIYLHLIHPCTLEEALMHPHPWPSAMLLKGPYAMLTGKSPDDNPPLIIEQMMLATGTMYEMIDPDGWHAVAPIFCPAHTLMVTGKPWGRPSPKPTKTLGNLTPQSRQSILEYWRHELGKGR